MNDLLDLPTLMLCAGVINFLNLLFVTVAWLRSNRNQALKYWAMAPWLAASAAGLASIAQVVDHRFAQLLAISLYISSQGLMWQGFRAFFGKPANSWWLGVPLLFFVPIYFLPLEVEAYTAFMVMGAFSGAAAFHVQSAKTILVAKPGEKLPSLFFAAAIFFSNALVHIVTIPLAYFFPVNMAGMHPESTWLFATILVLLLHTIATTYIIHILINERAELRLRSLANTDMLTGIANRRAFMASVESKLGDGYRGMLAIIDVDHFKQVNDTYGHMGGDMALCAFAKLLEAASGERAYCCRFGGEEFAVFVPDTNEEGGLKLLEQIRLTTKALELDVQERTVGITISIGASFQSQGYASLETLLTAADRALYAAKTNGRDRVEVAQNALRSIAGEMANQNLEPPRRKLAG